MRESHCLARNTETALFRVQSSMFKASGINDSGIISINWFDMS